MKNYSLTKNDGSDIGFANDCLIGSVISFSEFKEWLYHVIETSNEVPDYFFDILDIEAKFDYTLKTGQILGFHAGWGASDSELNALDGIGFKRFPNFKTDASVRKEAVAALSENPQVEVRFKNMFPFIQL